MKLLLDENLSRRLVPFLLETFPADFYNLSFTRGAPPWMLWLRSGNADKSVILKLLLERRQQSEAAFATGITCVELRP